MRTCIFHLEEGRITRADLPPQIARLVSSNEANDSLREQVRRFEIAVICKAINDAGGDRRAVARKLGIGLSSLYRKLEENEPSGSSKGN